MRTLLEVVPVQYEGQVDTRGGQGPLTPEAEAGQRFFQENGRSADYPPDPAWKSIDLDSAQAIDAFSAFAPYSLEAMIEPAVARS